MAEIGNEYNLMENLKRQYNLTDQGNNIFTLWVTIDGIWIGNGIYWTLYRS
jgi:hypothetical protein